MSAMDRVRALADRLRSLDSASGEAADLAKLIAVAEAAQQYDLHGDYDDLIAALDNLTSDGASHG
jgi:hypothetical protein